MSPQCGQCTSNIVCQDALRPCTSVSIPVGACRLILGQMKISRAIGRSLVGLQAGAQPVSQPPTPGRRAAAGDGEILRPKVPSLCALGDLARILSALGVNCSDE